ncbi:AAA family ATPase [Microlunatus sp. Y2014]|uniref:cytidylate kinase-like family protein n=1 Tax=Microlunatus sp. Y2014 TaxID=3418488 RepID=UPI003DA76F6D
MTYVPQRFSSDEVAAEAPRDEAERPYGPERLGSDSAFDRWLGKVSWTGTQDSDMAQAMAISEDHSLAQKNRLEVLRFAEDGAVIAGRNGAAVLGRAVGALHVRLTTPLSMRVQQVMAKTGLDERQAEARIAFEDRVRAEMSLQLYQWDPHTDEYYDLVINTGTVTYDQVVDMIVRFYRSKYPEAVVPEE